MTIITYDKDGGVRTFLLTLESVASSNGFDTERVRNPEELGHKHARLMVVHITDEDWKALLDQFSDEGVLLRVSSAGFPDAPPPAMIDDQKCVLHLIRRANDLSEADCVRMLEILSDFSKVKALVYEKQPQEVLRFFAHEALSNLVALSILCQGYLAVHAMKEGDRWGPPEIKSALEHMGWDSVAEKAAEMLGPDLEVRRKDASSPTWWSGIFRESKDNLQGQLADELGVSEIEDYPQIKALTDAMYGESPVQADIVAGAFCAISGKLSGRSCAHG